jgi:hypothetical protein
VLGATVVEVDTTVVVVAATETGVAVVVVTTVVVGVGAVVKERMDPMSVPPEFVAFTK